MSDGAPLDVAGAGLEYVGFWPRAGAALVDTVLVLLLAAPLLMWVYGPGYFDQAPGVWAAGPADVLISYVAPAIATVVFWLTRQATPGKMLVRARVVDARTGGRLGLRQSVLRYLGYYVALLPLGLGILWVAFDARKQGWQDKIAGTVVVRPKRGADAAFLDTAPGR